MSPWKAEPLELIAVGGYSVLVLAGTRYEYKQMQRIPAYEFGCCKQIAIAVKESYYLGVLRNRA